LKRLPKLSMSNDDAKPQIMMSASSD